jgi:hypothetical protein
MKKQIIFLSAFVIVISFANSSCKKKDKVTPPKTKTELITSAAWKYESAGIDSDNNGTIDIPIPATGLGSLPVCQTDNVSTLVSNGTGTVDEGPTKCAPADPQSAAFTWAFQTNETEINFSGAVVAGQSGVFKIITLNDINLVLSQKRTVPGFTSPVTVIATLKH